MSDTPRTKAATRMAFTSEYMVEIEEAQKLERDLTQSKEANAGLMRACDKLERELAEMTKQIDPYEREAAKAAINVLKRQLADMTKQRDHYKAACDQYSEDEMLCKLAEVTKQRDALAEALEEAKIAEMQLENADINLEQCRLNFVGRIKKLEQERDALAEALRTASERFRNPKYGCMWDDAADDIDKTLSAVKGGSHARD